MCLSLTAAYAKEGGCGSVFITDLLTLRKEAAAVCLSLTAAYSKEGGCGSVFITVYLL